MDQNKLTPRQLLDHAACLTAAELDDLSQQILCLNARRRVPVVAEDEGQLLTLINQGLPEQEWKEYRKLLSERDAGTLSNVAHRHLLELSDQMEMFNAKRIGYLAGLARLRGLALPELMSSLGL